jgi:hypothetical protein
MTGYPGPVRRVALLGVGIVLVLTGCGSAESDDARTAATAWFGVIATRDAAAACDLLVPAAAEALETAGGRSCTAALLDLNLAGGVVTRLAVWGDRAQARTAEDTVFLIRLSAGWKVSAAGCTPERDRPYDCEVAA